MDIADRPRAARPETSTALLSGAGTEDGLALDGSACERETIHIPGSIQPHGHLIILSAAGALLC
jgi:hypothetical protein